jgi:hypothetical protein
MAVKDFMKPGYGPRMGCTILTVDPKQRKIEAILKDGAAVQVAVFDTPGFFVWPKVGERWTIHKYNGIWMLNHRLGTEDDHQIDDLEPGQAKIDADIIKTPSGSSLVTINKTNVIEVGSIKIVIGTGSPEGVTTAPIGSLFLRKDGSSGSTLYAKTSGESNIGWSAVG